MRVTIWKVLIFYVCFIHRISNAEETKEIDNSKIYKIYEEMEKKAKDLAEKGSKYALPYVMRALEHLNLSSSCSQNLFKLGNGVRRLEEWAFEFLDASGKVQSGLMTGNVHMFGEYDQCLAINVMKKGKTDFRGQYCLIQFRPYLPKTEELPYLTQRTKPFMKTENRTSNFIKLFAPRASLFYYMNYAKFGACVPSGCSQEDMKQVSQFVAEKLYMEADVEFCQKKGDVVFWINRRIAIVSVFALFATLVILGTILEYMLQGRKATNFGIKILVCFSLITNFPKFASTKTNEKNLAFLYGLRSLATFWVILGHEYLVVAGVFAANHAINYEPMVSRLFAQIVLNGTLSVEIFFFMSGFLNAYIRTKRKESGKSQASVLEMIIHRLWRIYPALIACHLLYFIMNVSGPQGHTRLQIANDICYRNWWKNFLFVNNVFAIKEMCLSQTWFISVDMQLFLFSLITVPVLLRSRKKGIILHLSIVLIAVIISFVWWFVKRLPPTFELSRVSEDQMHHLGNTFNRPGVHVGSYFSGILLGYMMGMKMDVKMSNKIQVLGWLMSIFFSTFVLFLPKRWNSGVHYGRVESSLYGGFARTLFALGIAWLAYCCTTGRAAAVNYILSLKIWFPISKISYMTYLISPMLQLYYHANLEFPFNFSKEPMVWSYLGNLFITLLLSVVLSLIMESPFISLEKLIFRRDLKEKPASAVVPSLEIIQTVESSLNIPNQETLKVCNVRM